MIKAEANMKARIEEEYRVKAEAEAREKVAAEMRARGEADLLEDAAGGVGTGSSLRDRDRYAATNGGSGAAGAGSSHAHSSRGLRLTSPGGSSDGTEVNSLSARSSEWGVGKDSNHYDGPPFSGGRMLDVSEAEEMNAAIVQLYLKKPSGGGSPFVLYKAMLRTSKRQWYIERRYSDFVWVHEVSLWRVIH